MRSSDWSSDVCSSDLNLSDEAFSSGTAAIARDLGVPTDIASDLFGIDIAARVARDRELVDDALAELDAGDPLVAIGPDLDVARADEGLSAGELLVVLRDRKSTRLNSSH